MFLQLKNLFERVKLLLKPGLMDNLWFKLIKSQVSPLKRQKRVSHVVGVIVVPVSEAAGSSGRVSVAAAVGSASCGVSSVGRSAVGVSSVGGVSLAAASETASVSVVGGEAALRGAGESVLVGRGGEVAAAESAGAASAVAGAAASGVAAALAGGQVLVGCGGLGAHGRQKRQNDEDLQPK